MTAPSPNDTYRAVPAKQPHISNYGLVLTVYILYLVGFLTGITVLIGVIVAYLQRDETDPISISFPISDHNILDWITVFFCGPSNNPHRYRRLHLDMVEHLDTDSMRQRTPYSEQGQRYP
jgi:hypothetical protein